MNQAMVRNLARRLRGATLLRHRVGRWVGASAAAGLGMLKPVARAAASVICAPSARAGAALLAALALVPAYLACAVAGTVAARGLARLVRLPAALFEDGSLSYNVLLGAIAVGWLTRVAHLSPAATLALLCATAAITLVLSAALMEWLPRTAGLPPLSLAFTLVFGSLVTLFPNWAALSALTPQVFPDLLPGSPSLLRGFLSAMGTIFFMRDPFAGLLVAIALVSWSRLALVFAFAGYCGGMAVVETLGELGVVYQGAAAAHNYLLAGMALGAVYFVPSRATLVLATGAGAFAAVVAAVLQRALSGSGWEYLPLPFILTVWVLLLALRLRSQAGALVPAPAGASSPEAAWRAHARDSARFPALGLPHLAAPSEHVLTVTQGFDGVLSHRGLWRHALDFEAHDASGLAHRPGGGRELADFHTFGLKVCAPEAGTVVKVVNEVADNPPGGCNFAQNWGNHVVLRLDSGTHVTLAHFRRDGIHVMSGQRVAAGDALGECGNSGRSPIPHVHLQAQSGAAPAMPTLPFRLANYFVHGRDGLAWKASGVPAPGEKVSAARADPRILGCLAGMAPGRGSYKADGDSPVLVRMGATGPIAVACALDAAGRHVLTSDNGRLIAAAGASAWNTLECEAADAGFLWLLALGLPRAPYGHKPGMWWQDSVDWRAPRASARAEWTRIGADLIGAFGDWKAVATASRYTHDDGAEVRVRTILQRRENLAGAPVEIEVVLAPVRGVVALTAWFEHGEIRYRQTGFTAGADQDR